MNNRFDVWMSRVALIAIALISLGYIVCSSSFAELHWQPSFLSFPVFIGEILFAFCTLVFLVNTGGRPRISWNAAFGWMLLAVFIMAKAAEGYLAWGPFALRDSALFYYSFFALFAYCLWDHRDWGVWGRRVAFAVLFLLLISRSFYSFWPFSLITLALLFARQEEEFAARILLIAAVLLLAPYDMLFPFGRTVVVSTLVSLFFVGSGVFFASPFRKHRSFVWKALALMAVAVFLIRLPSSGFWRMMDLNRIFSQIPSTGVADVGHVRWQDLHLYNPDGSVPFTEDHLESLERRIMTCPSVQKSPALSTVKVSAAAVSVPASVPAPVVTAPVEHSVMPVDSAVESSKITNARFRVYIWYDMWKELLARRPLLGFSFGRPLRSPALEQEGIARGEWQRDGWIGAHNSFFYIIYKSGLIGIVLVGIIVVFWLRLAIAAVVGRSLTLILLCAVLLNWMVAANFFLILELPYTAIPFWTLFGITAKQWSMGRGRTVFPHMRNINIKGDA